VTATHVPLLTLAPSITFAGILQTKRRPFGRRRVRRQC
jgi:hypothetical protein